MFSELVLQPSNFRPIALASKGRGEPGNASIHGKRRRGQKVPAEAKGAHRNVHLSSEERFRRNYGQRQTLIGSLRGRAEL